MGLPGVVPEPQRNHLLPQRGKLRHSGNGVSLFAGADGRKAVPQDTGQRHLLSLPCIDCAIHRGLHPKLSVPGANYLLIHKEAYYYEKRQPFIIRDSGRKFD